MTNNHKQKKLNYYHVIGLLVLLFSLIVLTFQTTFAWFKDSSKTSNGDPQVLVVGTIGLDVTTNFNFYNLALAPDTLYTTDVTGSDIGTYIKTTSEHNINGCFVRIKFYCNRPEVSLHFGTGKVSVASTYTPSEKNKWIYNTVDDYYYYIGLVHTTNVQFNAGYFVDNTLHNGKAQENVEFQFVFETIQSQYNAYVAEWTSAHDVFKGYASTDPVHNP